MSTGKPQQDRTIVTDEQFAALCNLFHTACCEHAELTLAQIGDILYYHAYPVVCDHSRNAARAVMAYLGLRFAGGQPRHKPGSGCRFADAAGNCDFHDVRHANELVDQVEAEMRAGDGALSYSEAGQ
jgi:hypothetical protein